MSAQFIRDKAREISYALIRVAWYVKREDLRSRLEALAVELLENSSRVSADSSLDNANKALATISVLDGLVRLGHSIYEIEPVNATILVRELDSLNAAIRQSGNLNEVLPDLETFFRARLPEVPEENNKKEESLDSESKVNNNGLNAAIRQSAIINRIKSGNGCRFKDLLVEFPDVSERTLRYDLQRLCEQGVIERVGNGGPASYYKAAVQSVIN
ncbi:MAG: DeoR family transcriptional regulator [Candidatus Harrisonbacteria bacterium]|nr:DeoR family transcriptional regulator [Candidatus Harrisonbacteria bacterium]